MNSVGAGDRSAGSLRILKRSEDPTVAHTYRMHINKNHDASTRFATLVNELGHLFTDEHRAAVDWLNEITNEQLKFFGLEVELWRIGNSPMAPKFNIVAKPNDWSKDVSGGKARVEVEELTETKQLQLEFWTAFKSYAEENAKLIKPTKARPQHWMNMSIGRSGFNLTAIASQWSAEQESYDSNEIRAQVEVFTRTAKRDYEVLFSQKDEIERELGYSMIWVNEPNKVSCKVTIRKSVDLQDRTQWPEYAAWLVERLDDLHRVFSKRIKQIYPE